jgi:hypothetical protein
LHAVCQWLYCISVDHRRQELPLQRSVGEAIVGRLVGAGLTVAAGFGLALRSEVGLSGMPEG